MRSIKAPYVSMEFQQKSSIASACLTQLATLSASKPSKTRQNHVLQCELTKYHHSWVRTTPSIMHVAMKDLLLQLILVGATFPLSISIAKSDIIPRKFLWRATLRKSGARKNTSKWVNWCDLSRPHMCQWNGKRRAPQLLPVLHN